jgi:hypothetical protein
VSAGVRTPVVQSVVRHYAELAQLIRIKVADSN